MNRVSENYLTILFWNLEDYNTKQNIFSIIYILSIQTFGVKLFLITAFFAQICTLKEL